MDGAGTIIHNWTAVTACIPVIIPDDLQRSPGSATIETALENHVDVARVTTAFSTFAESQKGTFLRYDQGRNAEDIVVFGPPGEDGHLLLGPRPSGGLLCA